MLNTLSSLLLGAEAPAAAEEARRSSPQHAAPADDDWILVDHDDNRSEAELSDFGFPGSTAPSAPSTPASGWNLTPPACFDRRTPGLSNSEQGVLETSNFENLLLEHPTMSVYHASGGRPGRVCGTDSDRPRELSLAEFIPPALLDQSPARGNRALTPNRIDRSNRTVHFESSSRKNYRKKRIRTINAGVSDRKSQ